ncbi:hypothetical protein [Anaerosphaera aminiphila]|uniref:hypothetical protein n=1 Tax=Anaerosphaera aminiphila TaxID=1120994 RepID=UPI00117812C9|nr:hypothetical protein [Anaerosphaera aminiphila]
MNKFIVTVLFIFLYILGFIVLGNIIDLFKFSQSTINTILGMYTGLTVYIGIKVYQKYKIS